MHTRETSQGGKDLGVSFHSNKIGLWIYVEFLKVLILNRQLYDR
jgi:hypothetical protein